MSLFERIREKRINLKEQSFTDRQKSDMKKLLNKNFGSKEISKKTADTQKQLAKDNKKMYDVTAKSALRDAKKYASGEYPKIGGKTRMGPKSKGGGATTGGTKTVKQSDISKQAKKFTKKINKKNINRPEGIIGDTYVSTDKKGNIRSAKKVNPTLKKSVSQVKADIEFKQGIQQSRKLSGSKGTGELSDKAPQNVRDYVKKVRDKRIKDLKLPDTSFDSKTKAQTKFDDIFKGVKKTKKFKSGVKTQFDISKTPVGKMELPPKKVSPEVTKKTFDKFSKEISDATKQTKKVGKKIGSIKPPKTPSQPEIFGGNPTPSKTVKQSEVSKQAKEFTKKINQKKVSNTAQKMSTVKGDPLSPMGAPPVKKPKKTLTPKSTPKPKEGPELFKKVKKAISNRGGFGGKVTNSKGIGNQFRGKENKAAKDARIKADRAASGMGGGKPPKPPGKGGTLGFLDPDDTPKPKRVVTKQTRLLQSGQQKFAKSVLGKGLRKNLPQVYKGVRSLGPAGRAFAKTGVIGGAATIGTAFLAKNLLKKAAIGGVAGGIIGGAAASQKMSDKERIKKNLPAKLEKDKSGKDIKTVTRMNLNLSDVNKKKKDKGRTPQSIATEVEYLKKRQKVAPYGAKYTG